MPPTCEIRPGTDADTQVLIGFFDEAVAWMVARGQRGQWGDKPVASRAGGTAWVQQLAGSGGLRIAELDHAPAGALVVGAAPEHIPAIDLPELYVNLLITSRQHAGKQLGTLLVKAAIDEARAADREVLRVDCWAGAPALIAWYERHGFKRTGTFDHNGWNGQILSMPLN